jgi:cell wall-associated NlpC family hydrolase
MDALVEATAEERFVVVAQATRWLDTPFHHAVAVRGHGVDCAHLAAAVYEAAGVIESKRLPYYSPEWYLHEDAERLLERVREFCVPVHRAACGDLALFTFGRASAHVGIVIEWPAMIHVDRSRGVVREVVEDDGPYARRLSGFWSPSRWHWGERAA